MKPSPTVHLPPTAPCTSLSPTSVAAPLSVTSPLPNSAVFHVAVVPSAWLSVQPPSTPSLKQSGMYCGIDQFFVALNVPPLKMMAPSSVLSSNSFDVKPVPP